MFGNKARVIQQHQDDIQRLIQGFELPEFTPDLWQLEQTKSQLLFVHDDMMQLQPYHDMVKEGSLSGFYPFHYGYTTKKFSFVRKNLGLKSFPVALELREKDDLPMYIANDLRIRGEVYAIRPQQFIKLDTHRQNGVQFVRRRVNINIGYRKQYRTHWFNASGNKQYAYHSGKDEMCSVSAWMYVGREEYWKDQLQSDAFSFDPVDIITEDRLWLQKYYQYSRVR